MARFRSIIRNTMSRFNKRGNVDLDVLVSYGAEKVLDAVRRFDPSRRVKLKTWVISSLRGCAVEAVLAEEPGAFNLGRGKQRTASRLRKLTSRTQAQEEQLRAYNMAANTTPIHAPVGGTEGVLLEDMLADEHATDPGKHMDDLWRTNTLQQAMSRLSTLRDGRLEVVVRLRNEEGMTLKAIGQEFGVSESRALQLYNDGLEHLRRWLEPEKENLLTT